MVEDFLVLYIYIGQEDTWAKSKSQEPIAANAFSLASIDVSGGLHILSHL